MLRLLPALFLAVAMTKNYFSEQTHHFNFPNTWILLKSPGYIFEPYMGNDNKTWQLYPTFTLKLPNKLLLGLVRTSHNLDKFTSAGFANSKNDIFEE